MQLKSISFLSIIDAAKTGQNIDLCILTPVDIQRKIYFVCVEIDGIKSIAGEYLNETSARKGFEGIKELISAAKDAV